jgi:hypothetical protein
VEGEYHDLIRGAVPTEGKHEKVGVVGVSAEIRTGDLLVYVRSVAT